MIDKTIENQINSIREDRNHGASELAREAVAVIKNVIVLSSSGDSASLILKFNETGEKLVQTHPAMAPIRNIVSRFLEYINGLQKDDYSQFCRQAALKADELIEKSARAAELAAENAVSLFQPGDVVMTHSYSSTVMKLLCRTAGIEVIVLRSGVGRTGEQIARQLGAYQIPVTFIDDTASGVFLPVTDKIVVGADRVCLDGSIVNGAGTYPLAAAAHCSGTPFYVLCDTLKFDMHLRGNQVDLEDKTDVGQEFLESLPATVTVRNPTFDITPLELVTSVITEDGIILPEDLLKQLAGMS